MFQKILIANRGEIARRIARTARRLGVAVATVHSDADRDALHVQDIGESVRLGPAAARDSYLHIERVLQAARQVGADAVHPGYGFLSENADFAQAVRDAGLAFIGPSSEVLRLFGDKSAAKRVAQAAGLPTILGSTEASADPAVVRAMVAAIGYPVLLKAAAGGGGKGIRVVHSVTALDDEIAGAMREGRSAFGDPSLLVERYLPEGRHVEVQIVGDAHGQVLHLWERECSLQRRHQKVVEEAPALPLPAGLRKRLLEAAVGLGHHVQYQALGTVEFLVTGADFHFLEVNPRLQVEHPVTEAVTGLDLVEWQIRVAAGEALAFTQSQVRCDGHAVEVRVCAEDPATGFMPSTGRLERLSLPHTLARVETGVAEGALITTDYDPMVAKLITHGAHRADALAAMHQALAQTRIAGVTHNLGLVAALLRHPEVAHTPPTTATLDRLLTQLLPPPPAWQGLVHHLAAALALRALRSGDPARLASEWPSFTHWRLGAGQAYQPSHAQFLVSDDHGTRAAVVGRLGDANWQVQIGTVTHRIRFGAALGDAAGSTEASEVEVEVDGVAWRLTMGQAGQRWWVSDQRQTLSVRVEPALTLDRRASGAAGSSVVAPLAGKLLEVRVSDGDTVAEATVLLVIESMKMEHRVSAPRAGVVRALSARVGDSVERGATLALIDSLETAS